MACEKYALDVASKVDGRVRHPEAVLELWLLEILGGKIGDRLSLDFATVVAALHLGGERRLPT